MKTVRRTVRINLATARASGIVRGLLGILETTEDWNSLRREGVLDCLRDLQKEIDGLHDERVQILDEGALPTVLQAQEAR